MSEQIQFSVKSKARGWKAVFAAMNSLHDEASFSVSEEGILFYCLESSHNAALEMFIPRKNLQELTMIKPQVVGFRISELNKVFTRIDADADVTITKESAWLIIQVGDKKFEPRTIETDMIAKIVKINAFPELEYRTTPKDLANIVKDVLIFDEILAVEFDAGIMYFKSKGDKGKFVAKAAEGYPPDQKFTVLLSIDYFSKVIDPISSLFDDMIIKFGFNEERDKVLPAFFLCQIKDAGLLKFMLAPIEPR